MSNPTLVDRSTSSVNGGGGRCFVVNMFGRG
jgi:hypothetical protein